MSKEQTKTQSGNAILILVIALAVVILGTTGFLFWQNYIKPSTSDTAITSKQTDNQKTHTSTQLSIPDGWVWCENKEIGFKFAHPKDWVYVGVTVESNWHDAAQSFNTGTVQMPVASAPNLIMII